MLFDNIAFTKKRISAMPELSVSSGLQRLQKFRNDTNVKLVYGYASREDEYYKMVAVSNGPIESFAGASLPSTF